MTRLSSDFGGREGAQKVPKSFARCGANFAEDMKMSCRHFSWQAQNFVRVGGVEVDFSWQAQGIVRLRCLVEVSVAVPLGLAKLLGRIARCVRPDETSRFTFEGSLARNARLREFELPMHALIQYSTDPRQFLD